MHASPILMLAIVATVVCTAVVRRRACPIAGLPLVFCLLLGRWWRPPIRRGLAVFLRRRRRCPSDRALSREALLNDALRDRHVHSAARHDAPGPRADSLGRRRSCTLPGFFLRGAIRGPCWPVGRCCNYPPWPAATGLAPKPRLRRASLRVFQSPPSTSAVSASVAVLLSGLTVTLRAVAHHANIGRSSPTLGANRLLGRTRVFVAGFDSGARSWARHAVSNDVMLSPRFDRGRVRGAYPGLFLLLPL